MDTPLPDPDKYRFIRALRPFSYSVAVINCGLGVALAYAQPQWSPLRGVLVIIAGILLQAASNLFNDHADLLFWKQRSGHLADTVIRQIKRNTRIAAFMALLACIMGIWLAMEVGWSLLLLGGISVLGGYSYTGEPVNYKQRGLGIPAVFLLTGVFMVVGAYYGVTGEWDSQLVWMAVPVSLLSSALLLSNELRDYLDDRRCLIRTLTVRIGFGSARILYVLLLLLVYPISGYLFWQGLVVHPVYLLPSLLFVGPPILQLFRSSAGSIQLVRLPPLTGRFFLFFGIGFIFSVI